MYEYSNNNRPQDPWGDPIETTGRPVSEEPGPAEPRRKKKGAGKLVALCLVCAIVGGIAGGGGVAAATGAFSANRTTLLEGTRPATVVEVSNVTGKDLLTAPEIYAAYVGSTVGITTEIVTTNGWGQPVSGGGLRLRHHRRRLHSHQLPRHRGRRQHPGLLHRR